MVQESVPEEVTLELRPESAEGARNSKGWGKGEREVRPWEMKPEPSRRGGRPGEEPPPAGEGGGKGSAPPPAGRPTRPPHPASGEGAGAGRAPAAAAASRVFRRPASSGWEGGQVGGACPAGHAPRRPRPIPLPRAGGGQFGAGGLSLRPGPSAGQPFHFSHQFFNRAGAGLL